MSHGYMIISTKNEILFLAYMSYGYNYDHFYKEWNIIFGLHELWLYDNFYMSPDYYDIWINIAPTV